jgi:hypothetical protein
MERPISKSTAQNGAVASRIELEDFIEAASRAALRALDARKLEMAGSKDLLLNPAVTIGIWIGNGGPIDARLPELGRAGGQTGGPE